jgi:hypothetical protein
VLPGAGKITPPVLLTQGTLTADQQALSSTATWNNAAITFTHWKANVTDTASAAGSLLLDLQVGSNSKFKVTKAGVLQLVDGTVAAPSLAFANSTNSGLYLPAASTNVAVIAGGINMAQFNTVGLNLIGRIGFGASFVEDVTLARDAANTLAVKNGTNSQTFRVYGSTTGTNYVELTAASQITAGADASVVISGSVDRMTYKATVMATSCAAAFQAAATTADCTIATLPAKTRLLAVYADVTAAFTCSGTCTGTKTIGAGKTAGGTEILAAGLNVAVTGQFGLADANLGTAMVRAAAIQGGYLNSWTATTPVIVRFTSGTGNWGDGAATFVNAGSVTFYLITERLP